MGLDTLAVSLSLGIKSTSPVTAQEQAVLPAKNPTIPSWLRSALLFSLAEMLMPLVGLLIGYTASLAVSNITRYLGAILLISIGARECWQECQKHLPIRRGGGGDDVGRGRLRRPRPSAKPLFAQLLLALSISLDELAIGFSLGSLPFEKTITPLILCLYIGAQGFCLAALGIALGRIAQARLKPLKEWSELIGAVLLILLGIWLLLE